MMLETISKVKIDVWGDSVLKGVIYDKNRGKYTRLKEENAVYGLKNLGLDIRNNSHFGLTAPKARDMMARKLEKGIDCQYAIIEFGGNDCDYNWKEVSEHPEKEHICHTPLDEFKQCIMDMVSMLKKKNIRPVLVNLPPIDPERYFRWITRGLNARNILSWLGDVHHIYRHHECYNLCIMGLAGSLGCDLMDIRQPFLMQKDYTQFLCEDGIHPNQRGHALIQTAMSDYMKNMAL